MAAILAIGFAAIMSIVAPKVDKAKEQISMALFSFLRPHANHDVSLKHHGSGNLLNFSKIFLYSLV
ncbi:MAG: hypothetical protein DRJ51_06930 [Thermoprotei archaeon]|nr:MAG: hypothetical protein DRJ51_06930 [Thermoprotei archaeon]